MRTTGHASLPRPRFALGFSLSTSVRPKGCRSGHAEASLTQGAQKRAIPKPSLDQPLSSILRLPGRFPDFACTRSRAVSRSNSPHIPIRSYRLESARLPYMHEYTNHADCGADDTWMSSKARDHLIRFDGTQFVSWHPPKDNPLPGKITFLLGAHDGSLWIGTRAGLSRLKDGQLSNITKPTDRFGINVIIEEPHRENVGDTLPQPKR